MATRVREDQRRLRLFLDVAKQSGHLPRQCDPPVHIAGWYLDARDAAKTVSLGVWLKNLRTVRPKVYGGKSRLEMIRLHGAQPAAAALVEELEEWIRPCLEDQRRLRLFLDVAKQSGHLPRQCDPPVHIAGWYLDARDAAKTVSLGVWLKNLRTVRPKVYGGKSRLEMIRLHGAQPAAAALVEELEEW